MAYPPSRQIMIGSRLTWFEHFLNGWNTRFWKLEIFEKCPGPTFQKPTKYWCFENAPLPGSNFSKTRKNVFEKIKILEQLPGSKILLLAIQKNSSHIWEDAPRKVNNDEPDLRFFHGNLWPVISQAVRKPCFSTSIPRGQTCVSWISRHRRRRRRRLPTSRPLPTHPGMKYFREETLAVDYAHLS